MITPCLGTCAPAICKTENPDGTTFTLNSYGRRRRRSIDSSDYMDKFKAQRTNDRKLEKSDDNGEEVIVVQTIKITDNFAFDKEKEKLIENKKLKNAEYDLEERIDLKGVKSVRKSSTIFNCLSTTTITLLILVLVFIQIGFIVFWIYFKQAIKSTKSKQWSFDNQIDSIRYSNTTQFNTNPASFYSNNSNRQASISSKNQKF